MAQLEKPVLPTLIYRYRRLNCDTIEQELDSLRDCYLWCSIYKNLNDPMEGYYNPSSRFQNLSNYDNAVRNILNAKHLIGICSFSDTPDNELMWTHYADNYRGICIGYRPRSLLKGLPSEARLAQLTYGLNPPELGKHDGNGPSDLAARKVLSHKKSSWSYEREWRVFGTPGKLHFTGNCIAEVRLGSRMPDKHRQRLASCLSETVRMYQMTIEHYLHRWTLVAQNA